MSAKPFNAGIANSSMERTEKTNHLTADIRGIHGAREFARRFTNLLYELRLQAGIHQRIERLLNEFADAHPNPRATYISRDVDDSYFSDGAYGWEAAARPKLHGLALEGDNVFEFLAFSNGLRTHTTPLESIVNVEELWLEAAPNQPFVLRVCCYHSFPATTVLYAPNPDSQEAAVAFVERLKYLKGF